MASGNSIQALREARGWSRPQLGERMGTSGQQIERLEKGQRKLSQDWIEKAATALGVPAAQILAAAPVGSLPDLPATRSADAGETVEIVAVDLSYAMGGGRTIDDYVEEEPFRFDLGFIRSISRAPPHRLRLARGIGDSMLPTLQSYDRVMVDTTQNRLQLDDRVYAISRDGAGSIKRLRRAANKRILVKSDNPHVDDFEVDEDELIIHGRVIWFARDL